MKRIKINMNNGKTSKGVFLEHLFNCKARVLRKVILGYSEHSYAQIIRYTDKEMVIKNIDKEVYKRILE